MLILNLAIAAVVDGIKNAEEDNDRVFKTEDLDKLLDIWSSYDE